MPAAPYSTRLAAQQGADEWDADEGAVGHDGGTHQHGLLTAGQVHGPAQHKADADGEDVEDLQHHIAFEHAGHGLAAAVDAGTGQQGAGQGNRHDQVDRNLLFLSSMMPSLVTAAPVPISRKMIRICCRRIAIDMAAPYTVSTIPAPVVVRRSWSMATWPLTMHQSRPVAFWAGFVKVA